MGADELDDMRRNIDAWWPLVEGEGRVEAIVMNASGCGVTVKEYPHALAEDPAYVEKARRIAALTVDLSELLRGLVPQLRERLAATGMTEAMRATEMAGATGAAEASPVQAGAAQRSSGAARRLAFHPPCTLQHGQQLRGGVETTLRALGFEVELARTESHLCCGSAGTYSVLQPELAYALRDRKLAALDALEPRTIVSANIGCIQHLQTGTTTPVRHWIEVLDDALAR